MTKVVMIVQGIVLEGNLPEGISPEGAIQSGQTLELGRVNLIGMAVRTLPSMQIRTSDIAAISVSPSGRPSAAARIPASSPCCWRTARRWPGC